MMTNKNSRNSEIIADQIHSAAIHLLRKLRREDADSGLNAPRLSALSVVVFAGPVTLGDLAAAEQVRPPTMTRIVDALESQSLVTRTRNLTDGRSTMITATAPGKKLLIQGRERRVRALARQIDALGPKQKATLLQAAGILRQVVDSI
jgi:DNA-binding MarR family transcriptional regulator